MSKKAYNKPLLATRIVALGVFGDYNTGGPDTQGGGGDALPNPFKPRGGRIPTMD